MGEVTCLPAVCGGVQGIRHRRRCGAHQGFTLGRPRHRGYEAAKHPPPVGLVSDAFHAIAAWALVMKQVTRLKAQACRLGTKLTQHALVCAFVCKWAHQHTNLITQCKAKTGGRMCRRA